MSINCAPKSAAALTSHWDLGFSSQSWKLLTVGLVFLALRDFNLLAAKTSQSLKYQAHT